MDNYDKHGKPGFSVFAIHLELIGQRLDFNIRFHYDIFILVRVGEMNVSVFEEILG